MNKLLLTVLLMSGLGACSKDKDVPTPDLFLGHWRSIEVDRETEISPGVSTGRSTPTKDLSLDVTPTQLTITNGTKSTTYDYRYQDGTILYASGNWKGITTRIRGLTTTSCSYEDISLDSIGRVHTYRVSYLR
jgi:hypothetical protein